MEKLVLDRLLDEIARPGRLAEQRAEKLAEQLTAAIVERDRLRTDAEASRKAELPFSDLFCAADRVIKSRGVARKQAIIKLKAAMVAAEKHIDWIPF